MNKQSQPYRSCLGRRFRGLVAGATLTGMAASGCRLPTSAMPPPPPPSSATFAGRGEAARAALQRLFYAPSEQKWHKCAGGVQCGTTNHDWGADSLTYDLWFRHSLTGDPTIVTLLHALDATAPAYTGTCRLGSCSLWSDEVMWDALAAVREHDATHETHAVKRAEDDFTFIDRSDAFWFGACPTVAYQHPGAGGGGLKTLETDSNYIKTALLLYERTHERGYLDKAAAHYAAARQYYLDPSVPLYTVWLVDDGKRCPQIPRRFYASVNGNMITSGLLLARATGDASYREQALATAHAIDTGMSDGAGIFEDLQAENDVVEPLVEAFYDLAKTEDEPFARDWILRNAAASDSATTYEGSYGRFWGGPRPKVATTCFQANGGFALAFAAAALAPEERPLARDVWTLARHVTRTISALPAKIDLDGRAIAIMGAIGDRCCEEGHIRVLLDGVETFDGTGIWQNKSSAKKTIPDSVLFAWRWPESGHHTIDLLPGQRNPKEGSTFVHVEGYDVVP